MTIVWIVVGVVTAVFLYQLGRWVASSLRRQIKPMETYSYETSAPLELDMGSGTEGDSGMATAVDEPVAFDDAPPIAMGLDEAAPATGEESASEEEMLRMDVAVPPQVEIGRAFDLAVALCQIDAPKLAEEDLTKVASGPVAVTWEEAVERAVVRIQVTAPDCDIDIPEQTVTLARYQDEPPVYFLLTPRRTGRISIQVKVYQESLLLGNARVKTEAAEEVGQVTMEVTSHPLSLTLNDRRLLRQNLTGSFDLGELHGLIFSLGLDKDNFPQEKDELIIDLVQTCLQQGLLRDLVMVCREERPLLIWKLESIPD